MSTVVNVADSKQGLCFVCSCVSVVDSVAIGFDMTPIT